MNYIRHLHAFYHQVQRDDRLSAVHVSLYLAIFQFWNFNRFQNPFRIDREDLMKFSRIGSKNTYHKCIKELHDYRYIIYHTGITKYQNVKVSMIRLDLKAAENAFLQLDLFGSGEINSGNQKPAIQTVQKSAQKAPVLEAKISQQKDSLQRTEIDTPPCTKNDTPQRTDFDTPWCPKNGTISVPDLTGMCPKNGTVCVPNVGHNIKHKQINSKHCVCLKEKKTHTQIFKKNKNLENSIQKIAGKNDPKEEQKKDACRGPNLIPVPQKNGAPEIIKMEVSLPLVQDYFRQNNFPITEALKFFYYNKGRGWMLSETMPVKDWQALAQKWMLKNQETKSIQNDNAGNAKNKIIDTRTGKDYSEPL